MKQQKSRIFIGALITLGIVYGDIGTSPLYVMNALLTDLGGPQYLTKEYVIGCLSLIFWTLMLMTTVKYVLIALRADNRGEGGIFALYALVRQHKKWLIYPALIGGAALLADGTLTPAVTSQVRSKA
ncbi:Kup system potassium uptake protein [Ligilactobacillus apodemi DSM 16634 = JCM 16172]|uniref:Kup system potassium uptake protein n=1 Tax=Ligilactobacillus apodemi DSM 16634 = JCM 16172 TaxID=1423724 RepID=A0A0R1U1U1_9LACO|nr:Kup system potassium uptake protein [Ligilactobacillus apodemi DSM 16634 = JCM 16172]